MEGKNRKRQKPFQEEACLNTYGLKAVVTRFEKIVVTGGG